MILCWQTDQWASSNALP